MRIPSGAHETVCFPLRIGRMGTARFQIVARDAEDGGVCSNLVHFSLPVEAAAPIESYAVHGSLDRDSIVESILVPPNVDRSFGSLEITFASTEHPSLVDAIHDLAAASLGGTAAIASRLLALSIVKAAPHAFRLRDLSSPEAIDARAFSDLQLLIARQNRDGGFGLWGPGQRSSPFASIHAAHALALARAAGWEVTERTWLSALHYLSLIRRLTPRDYPEPAPRALEAYAIYVRALMGDPDFERAHRLVLSTPMEKTPVEALGWLLPVVRGSPHPEDVALIEQRILNHVLETGDTVTLRGASYEGDHLLFRSDVRTAAIVTEGLIAGGAGRDLVPRLVQGLWNAQRDGHWAGSQENVFALLALAHSIQTPMSSDADMRVRVWLGNGYGGEHRIQGPEPNAIRLEEPLHLLDAKSVPLVISKAGPGRLNYRIALRLTLKDPYVTEEDHGFTLERSYEAVDDEADVWRDETGIWHVRAGARVRVRILLASPDRHFNVSLTDALPAGFEAIRPDPLTTSTIVAEPDAWKVPWWSWLLPWYDQHRILDDRVEAYASLVWGGIHAFSYIARASTRGTFIVPPAQASEMVQPERYGRSSSDWVVIE